MDAAMVVAWTVAAIRAATGVWFLASPGPVAENWVGDSSLPARYLVRAVGARDLVLGAGLAWALASDSEAVAWLLASIVADGFDTTTGLTMLSGRQRTRTVAAAGAFGILGIVAVVLLVS